LNIPENKNRLSYLRLLSLISEKPLQVTMF
jgi:hypothetical protein